MCLLPRLTPDLNRVSIIFLRDPAVENFNPEVLTKVAFMGQDVVMKEPPTAGDILIWDARGYTLAHAMSVSPLFIRKALQHITVSLGRPTARTHRRGFREEEGIPLFTLLT